MNIVVVSLFDGCSCARVALEQTEGIKVLRYYSSEVDKYAIQIANKHYPQDSEYRLGDIRELNIEELTSSIRSEFTDAKILLVGGSPCTNFSLSGNLKGSSTKCGIDVVSLEQYLKFKEEGFEFEGQSYLFWEYIRVKQALMPDFFLLENVKVTKKWLPMFNKATGVEPTLIDSALVSAQRRKRYYWAGVRDKDEYKKGTIPQPEDKGFVLGDILENIPFDTTIEDNWNPEVKSNYLQYDKSGKGHGSQDQRAYFTDSKHGTLTAGGGDSKVKVTIRPCELKSFKSDSDCHHIANATDIKGNESIKRVYAPSGKSPTVTSCQGGHREPKVWLNEKNIRYMNGKYAKHTRGSLNKNPIDGKGATVTANTHKGLPRGVICNNLEAQKKLHKEGILDIETFKKTPQYYRKLTPLECERLQTFKDKYTEGVSNTQRFKLIGNAFTIDVIAHILEHLIIRGIEQ